MGCFKISTEQDRGWAWVVLAGTTVNTFLSLGVTLGSAVYVMEIINGWNVGKASGALAGSLFLGIFFAIGPLSTMLASRTSHRTTIMLGGLLSSIGLVASANVTDIISFYFTFSILGGIGCGMVFVQSVIFVNLYFKRFRGIASGITMMGGGTGVMAIPLLQRMLIDHFSWRPSLYIIAGLCLNTCTVGALMRPICVKSTRKQQEISGLGSSENIVNVVDMDTPAQSSEKLQLHAEEGLSLLQNKTYICYVINNALFGLGSAIPMILGPDLYTEMGFVGLEIDILIFCFGFGNVIGRIVAGVLCNLKILNRLALYFVLAIIFGGFVALYTASNSFILCVIASTGHGFSYGAYSVTNVVIAMDIVGRLKMAQAVSSSYFAASLGSISGPPIAGLFFGLANSYTWPYLIAAMILILSAFLLVHPLIARSRCASPSQSASNMTIGQMSIEDHVEIPDPVIAQIRFAREDDATTRKTSG